MKERYLTRIGKLYMNQRNPSLMDKVRFMLDGMHEHFGYQGSSTLHRTDDGIVITVIPNEQRNAAMFVRDCAKHRFGVTLDRIDSKNGYERLLVESV